MNNVIGNVASTALKDKQQNACNNRLSIVIISNAMFEQQIKDAWKHGNIPTFLGRVLTAEQYYKETYERN